MNLIEAKSWADEMDMVVTVCDLNAKIVYMNEASIKNFAKKGGKELIGKSLFDCHNQKSNELIKGQLNKRTVNVYESDKKIIRQFPWIENGEHKGIIEISFDVNKKDKNETL